MQNPYAAPGASYGTPFFAQAAGNYVPLGWRTVTAGLAIAGTTVFSFLVDLAQLISGNDVKADSTADHPLNESDPRLAHAVLQFVAGLGLVVAFVAGAVFFGIWLHRAVKNLRGLGRTGMEYTPGGSVASFYIPFVNLVRPYRAVSELWRASEPGPESEERGWSVYGATTPLVSVWWGFWIACNLVANASSRIEEPAIAGAIGLGGSALMAVAAYTCITRMQGIGSRQEAAAARLAGPR
jgi:hypothetical protein